VLAGQNGGVWIKGPFERINLVVEAVKYIEQNSHQSGLTDNIKKMIKEKRKEI
jgi:exosome complex RNA-binding protein Rrp4